MASPSPRVKSSVGPGLPNATRSTHALKADPTTYHAARSPGGSRDIRIEEENKRRERQGWDFEHQKELAVRHRSASAGSKERLNSWSQPPSAAQAAWNESKRKSTAKKGNVAMTELIERERRNAKDRAKMKLHENTKEQTMRINERNRHSGLEGRRGEEHDMRSSGRKYIDEKNYHNDALAGRTASMRTKLKESAIVKPSTVEHSSTHRRHGHLSDAEQQDYMGLRQGEELDEEGRVVPPWAVQEKYAQRYLGPMGEDYRNYNADYPGVDVEAAAAWSARPPPPQMYLRDERGENIRRSDSRLPHDPAGYGQPFHGPYARLYESPAAVASGYGYAGYPAAIAGPGYGYPYGYPAY